MRKTNGSTMNQHNLLEDLMGHKPSLGDPDFMMTNDGRSPAYFDFNNVKQKKMEEVELINANVNFNDEESQNILSKEERHEKQEIDTSDIIELFERTLKKRYNIDQAKFDVRRLINVKGIVRGDLL